MTDPSPGGRPGGAGVPGVPPGLDRVDHVGIVVRDVDASLPYWRDALGLPLVGDEVADEPGARLAYLDAGNALVQLVQPVRDGPLATFLAERGEGLHHVCFAVERIEATLAALPGEGGASVFRGGRGRRACFLTGAANGAVVELTEHRPAP